MRHLHIETTVGLNHKGSCECTVGRVPCSEFYVYATADPPQRITSRLSEIRRYEAEAYETLQNDVRFDVDEMVQWISVVPCSHRFYHLAQRKKEWLQPRWTLQ